MDIENKTWTSEEMLFPGMWVYRDVFNNFSIIEKMEDFLNNNSSKYTWKTATVGYIQENLDYRNCLDFKLGEIENPKNTDQMFLNLMWKNLYNLQSSAANRYCDRYNIKMNYWEDRKSTRLNSSHSQQSRMPSSA